LVEGYLKRNDEELAELKAARRPGQPASTSQDLLRAKQDLEQKEYNSGFWMPDMEDAGNIIRLRGWDGSWIAMNALKFVRITRAGQKQESQFPPFREK
jgi:translation machinery-associated protein 16